MIDARRKGLSLQARLLTSYGFTLALAALSLGALAVLTSRASVEHAHFERLSAVAAVMSATISELPASDRLMRMGPDSARTRANFVNELNRARDATDVARVRILRPDFSTIVDTGNAAFGADAFDLRIDQAEIESVLNGRPALSSQLVYGADGSPVMRGYAPVRSVDGVIVAFVAVDGPADVLGPIYRLTAAIVVSALLMLVLFLVVTTGISRRITAPITALVDVADQVEQGNYDRLGPNTSTTGLREVDRLANALLSMGRTLQRREEDQQMMVAGIAHEIRNPLAGLRLRLDLLAQDVGDTDSAAIEVLRGDLDHLERVVEDFLQWTRRSAPKLHPVFVLSVADTVVHSLSAVAADRGVSLLVVSETAGPVLADEHLLRSVMHNLVLNAVQASVPGSTVRIDVTGARDEGLREAFGVVDAAGGLSEEELEQAMRPFFTSREKGSGLGLPLSQRSARLMGGRLDIRSQPGVGLHVRLLLQDAPPSPIERERDAGVVDVDDGSALIG